MDVGRLSGAEEVWYVKYRAFSVIRCRLVGVADVGVKEFIADICHVDREG